MQLQTGSGFVYADRIQAGRLLAEKLLPFQGRDVLVLAIPRGGVPVAAEVARRLDGDLDVIVARKLGAPGQPELAIGAVTANGGEYINDRIVGILGVSEDEIDAVRQLEAAEARRRESLFRGDRPAPRIRGRVVILIDDGLATGATMRAAARSIRRRDPEHLVIAAPVGAFETCEAMRREADEVVCPNVPLDFDAVGRFYRDFEATGDDEVQRLLAERSTALGARG